MSFSVNYDNNEKSFYDQKYSTTPIAQNKVEYSVKKGDNLWNIAKEHLKKENASNNEILEMMYKIAKLNNKESLDAASNIKINEILFLPVDSFVQQGQEEKKDPLLRANEAAEKIKKVLYPNNEDKSPTGGHLAKFNNTDKIPQNLATEHAKAGLDYWTELMEHNDEDLIVRKSYSVSVETPSALELIKKDKNGETKSHMYIEFDSNKNFKGSAFDAPGIDVLDIRFDYETDKDGKISVPHRYGGKEIPIGSADAESYKEFKEAAQNFIDKNT